MASSLLSTWLVLQYFIQHASASSIQSLLEEVSHLQNVADGRLDGLIGTLRQAYPHISQGKLDTWEMVQVAALCSLLPGIWYLRRKRKDSGYSWTSNDTTIKGTAVVEAGEESNDAESSDPGLLKKYSDIKSYSTSRYTYPKIRVFFRRHPQADKLPTDPAPLPLLVFIHGLGGSVAQFHPVLTSLVNLASCLSIDLPGCGMSTCEPKDWDAYTTQSLAELVGTIIEEYREKGNGQGVVLVGHSMGCSIAALLASKTSAPRNLLSDHVVGLVAICPRAETPTEEETALFKKLLYIPGPIFDLWRTWDKRGGIESKSVYRFVGADADDETKRLQYRFNQQSKTPTWRRMAAGSLSSYKSGIASGGLPGREVWAGLEIPVFLVAGEADNVTKPAEIEKISDFLGKSHPVEHELANQSQPIADSAAPVDLSNSDMDTISSNSSSLEDNSFVKVDSNITEDPHEDPSTPNEELSVIPTQFGPPKKVLKTTILPAPATHALLYQPSTVRILAGLISDFLCSQVSPRLSLGWQLQFLSTAGKWDVKNLAKWQAVSPVSAPIAGVFRAMKTLREVDESHCPEVFVREWGSQIKDIVDISHESPVYDPRGLERGGIRYHKFPTVSKIPPTAEEVTTFIALVDRLIEEQKVRADKEDWGKEYYIGVHCHYGFNRTGYFVVCYLIERLGYDVQKAIDEFARCRPKGIKHAHFLDQIFVRYCKGLKRAPTL